MKIPRVHLIDLPTPIQAVNRVSGIAGRQIWIKRDDLAGSGLGGNSYRKMEYILAEILANGAKTVITAGTQQSNHCRITAEIAARMALDCILVLEGEPPEHAYGNLWMDELFGAEIVFSHAEIGDVKAKETFTRAWEKGRRPYLVQRSGANPTGILGYKNAFDEVMSQELKFDTIITAVSSGSTLAGLLLGAKLAGWSGKLIGIQIDPAEKNLKKRIAKLAIDAADFIDQKIKFDARDFEIYPAIDSSDRAVMDTIRLFASKEGILLDPDTSGLAAAGMMDLCQKNLITRDEKALFWHTGGLPEFR